MTFQEFFETVNNLFQASYPGTEPIGSFRKTDQMSLVWGQLQSTVLSFGLISNPSREITVTASERTLDLSSLDPPIGSIVGIVSGQTPLAKMTPQWFMWQDRTLEGTVMGWVQTDHRTVGFWPIPSTNTDLVLECTEGLESGLETTGELPFDMRDCLAIAGYVAHQISPRFDPNLAMQARIALGGVSARRLSSTLSVHRK